MTKSQKTIVFFILAYACAAPARAANYLLTATPPSGNIYTTDYVDFSCTNFTSPYYLKIYVNGSPVYDSGNPPIADWQHHARTLPSGTNVHVGVICQGADIGTNPSNLQSGDFYYNVSAPTPLNLLTAGASQSGLAFSTTFPYGSSYVNLLVATNKANTSPGLACQANGHGFVNQPMQRITTPGWTNYWTTTYGSAGGNNLLPQNYNFTVTCQDAGGSGSLPVPFTIQAAPALVPSFTASALSGSGPLTVSVNAAASTGAGTLAYSWSFGDGAIAAGVTASHTYTSAGTFTLTLSMTDSLGRGASTSKTITVIYTVPHVTATSVTPASPAPAGTTGVQIAATTDINTTCTIDGTAFQTGQGTTNHLVNISNLINGYNHTYAVVCSAGGQNSTTATVNVTVNMPSSIPKITATSVTPASPAPAGTTGVQIAAATDINTTCTIDGTAFQTGQGTTNHLVNISNLTNGYNHTYAVVCSAGGQNSTTATVNVTVKLPAGNPLNVALNTNGATALGSSEYFNGNYKAAGAITGNKSGIGWGTNTGGWDDNTAALYPDWLQINFAGTKNIVEVDVYTLQDNYTPPAVPTAAMTFTQYGITDFNVQYYNGSSWTDVPNGHITNNNLVWRKLTFAPVATAKIRVLVNNSLANYSRIVDVEAYEGSAPIPKITATSVTPASPAPAGTTGVQIAAATDINTTCTIDGTAFQTGQGTTNHLVNISNLTNGYNHTYAVVCSAGGQNSTTATVNVTVKLPAGNPLNVALNTNGATALGSSEYFNGNYKAAGAITGNKSGIGWGTNTGGWDDNTAALYPDWLQINFAGTKNIVEVDVYTLQDNYTPPAVPTAAMTFTQYGITDFNVQYYNGSSWTDVPNGHITNNNLVWRKLTFAPVATAKIRVLVNNSLANYSRIVDVEAYEGSAPAGCANTAACGDPTQFYCDAARTCQGLPRPTVTVNRPLPLTAYGVGQTGKFSATATGLSQAALSNIQTKIFMDATAVCSNNSPICYPKPRGPAPYKFVAADLGSHNVSAKAYVTDITGAQIPVAQSAPYTFFVSSGLPGMMCQSPAYYCTAGNYCNGAGFCEQIPDAVVTITNPVAGKVFAPTDSVTITANAVPKAAGYATNPFAVSIFQDGVTTPICSGQGATCSLSGTVAVGDHSLTAVSSIQDLAGRWVNSSQSAVVSFAVKPPADKTIVPATLVVKYKVSAVPAILAGTSGPLAHLRTLNKKYRARAAKQYFTDTKLDTSDKGRIVIYELSSNVDLAQALQDYKSDSNVEYAHADHILPMPAVPNDYYANKKGDISNPTLSDMWAMVDQMQWPLADGLDVNHKLGAGTKIALLDTGVERCHPDLVNAIDWANSANILNCPLLDTHKPDPKCTYTAEDFDGHGTATAGEMVAQGNNSIGIFGVVPNAKVLPITIHSKQPDGTVSARTSVITNAINYILNNPSFGVTTILIEAAAENGGILYEDSPAHEAVIAEACAAGITVIQPAGNGHSDVAQIAPQNMVGACKPIVVGMTDLNDWKKPNSNFGDTVDVAAAGTWVATTRALISDNSYTSAPGAAGPDPHYTLQFSGTSGASPYVAGLAAWLKSLYPALTPPQIRAAITKTADLRQDSWVLGTSKQAYPANKNSAQPHPVGRLNMFLALESFMPSPGLLRINSVTLEDYGTGAPPPFQFTDAWYIKAQTNNIAVGCKLDELTNGTHYILQSVSWQDHNNFIYGVVGSWNPGTYNFNLTCTDIWGSQATKFVSFKILPASALTIKVPPGPYLLFEKSLFDVQLMDHNDNPIDPADYTVTWSAKDLTDSANTNFTMQADGNFSPEEEHTYDITAAVGGLQQTVTITASKFQGTIQLTSPPGPYYVGTDYQFDAKLLDRNGQVVNPQPTIEWSTLAIHPFDDMVYAYIGSSGLWASFEAHDYRVLASYGGILASADFTAVPAPGALSIMPPAGPIYPQTPYTFQAEVQDTQGNPIANPTAIILEWDDTVKHNSVTLQNGSTVISFPYPGNISMKAFDQAGHSQTISVHVLDALGSIRLTPPAGPITAGSTRYPFGVVALDVNHVPLNPQPFLAIGADANLGISGAIVNGGIGNVTFAQAGTFTLISDDGQGRKGSLVVVVSASLISQSITITPVSTLSGMRVYPNPWRPSNTKRVITFDQLPNNTSVKIFTVSGHFVKSLPAPSGSADWDMTNDSGEKVQSGLYIYVLTDPQGNKQRGKVAVIR